MNVFTRDSSIVVKYARGSLFGGIKTIMPQHRREGIGERILAQEKIWVENWILVFMQILVLILDT